MSLQRQVVVCQCGRCSCVHPGGEPTLFLGWCTNKSYVIATSDLWLFIHASNLLPSTPHPTPLHKDKSFWKNWRPVTLLNIPYKISSSCIGQRLKSVLPKFRHKDQKGFLKGRVIGENRLLYNALLCTSKHNVRGLFFMVDCKKALIV